MCGILRVETRRLNVKDDGRDLSSMNEVIRGTAENPC